MHTTQTPAAVAKEWIHTYYDYLPKKLQFPKEDLQALANYFASYLNTSFDFFAEPGLVSSGSCNCDLCQKLLAASHLKARKPNKQDHQEAMEVCINHLLAIAQEFAYDLSREKAKTFMEQAAFARDVAYLSYINSIIHRMAGIEVGTYVLVLWRKIAWKATGSPIRNFSLSLEAVLKAEKHILAQLNSM